MPRNVHKRRRLGACARGLALAAAVTMFSSGLPAFATPSAPQTSTPPSVVEVPADPQTEAFRERLAELQAQADVIKLQLDELDRELAIASEEFNRASEELSSTREKLDASRADLANAETAYGLQHELLSKRAGSIYRQGDLAFVDMLLDAKSVSDFIARAKFLNTIGVNDADLVAQLSAQRDLLRQSAKDLAAAQRQAEALEFELDARRIEIMLRIDERERMLREVDSDVMELLAEEAERRQTEEGELLAAILRGASGHGIDALPGTPVETALAYHGVPYLWGGESPAGFDCSGLVLYVFRQHGVTLPHYSGSQFLMGQRVSAADLRANDVVFFGSPIHHVGIYIGGGYYIHAPRTGDFVKVSRLAARRDYAGARRYSWSLRQGGIVGLDKLSPNVNHNVGVQLDR